jgi:CheY-like chemotaxis protein
MIAPAAVGRSVLVLIADDEGPIAAVVAEVVEDLGYRPQVVRNGREALDLARTTRPALIITDLMMPGLTGAELIAALRADAADDGRHPPPVILITAASPHTARRAGADAFLSKPFDLDELEAAITHLLNRAAQNGSANPAQPSGD